jgi:hypothetical protein
MSGGSVGEYPELAHPFGGHGAFLHGATAIIQNA